MAIAPGTYDMTIQRRSDHSVSVTLKDSSNAAVNLGGYTIASQVWNTDRTTKAADVTCTITNAAGGAFDWKLTDTQTALLTLDEYKYDVLLTNGSVITVATVGPQGDSAVDKIDLDNAINKSIVYYDSTSSSLKADATWTTSSLTNGGNF